MRASGDGWNQLRDAEQPTSPPKIDWSNPRVWTFRNAENGEPKVYRPGIEHKRKEESK